MRKSIILLILLLSGCASLPHNHDDYVEYWNSHPLVKN